MPSPGYWIRQRVLSEGESESLITLLCHDGVRRSRAGARNLMPIVEIHEFANDERLLQIGEDITGFRLIPYKATLFEKTGKANWLVSYHQDTALPIETAISADGWGPSSVKDGITFCHAPTWARKRSWH